MGRFILRRLLISIPTLIVISFVVYATLALAPGDPLSQFAANPQVPPEVRERIREALGLNQPWYIRYVKWLQALVTGDFGFSFMSHSPVRDLIAQRLPNTLAVVGVAYVVGVLIGLPIGVLSAVKRYSPVDHSATTFAFIGISVPTFFTGLLLIIIFSVPGIGELLVRSIGDDAIPVVAAIVFIFAVLVVLFNLVADILYAVLDPRIRYT